MAEYSREQRNQLSRAVANTSIVKSSEIDNRESSIKQAKMIDLIQHNTGSMKDFIIQCKGGKKNTKDYLDEYYSYLEDMEGALQDNYDEMDDEEFFDYALERLRDTGYQNWSGTENLGGFVRFIWDFDFGRVAANVHYNADEKDAGNTYVKGCRGFQERTSPIMVGNAPIVAPPTTMHW